MKKIFYAIIIAASVVACGKVDNSMYFDRANNRIYEDATAEFDTLSYAVGMNFGLGLRQQQSGVPFDYETLIATINEELAKDMLDFEAIEENKLVVKQYIAEHLRPYAIEKLKSEKDKPAHVLTVVKPLYNTQFPEDRVAKMFGVDMANYIFNAAYPLNMYWTRIAMQEAATLEYDIIHDSLMRLSVMQMRDVITNYHARIQPEFIVETAREWLNNVAKQPNVNRMVVDEFDTLYFRVNKAGNGIKPRSMNDTISFSYDLYTRSGKLIESHAKRANMIREALEEAKAADTLQDSKNSARIKQLTDQLNNLENLRVPLSKALLKGLQYGIQNIGEGGEITVWMPASLAFGEQGNRIVPGHDAVVMNITLKSVSYGPTEEELAAMQKEKKKANAEMIPNAIFAPKQKPNNDAKKPSNNGKHIIKPVELKN